MKDATPMADISAEILSLAQRTIRRPFHDDSMMAVTMTSRTATTTAA